MSLEFRSPERDSDGVKASEAPGVRRAAWVLAFVTLVVGLGTFLVIGIIRRGGSAAQRPVEATQRAEPTSAGEPNRTPAPAGLPIRMLEVPESEAAGDRRH